MNLKKTVIDDHFKVSDEVMNMTHEERLAEISRIEAELKEKKMMKEAEQ